MNKFVEIESFNRKMITDLSKDQRSIEQFKIFNIQDLLVDGFKHVSYSKRHYFKISLITGHNNFHYADQSVEITESALIFTNPMIPYSWEILSNRQAGYVCIFTEDLFSQFGNIKEYPVFQSAAKAIIPLSRDEAIPYGSAFSKMVTELDGDYAFKFDVIRNLLFEIIHTAQKRLPMIGANIVGSNAAERISALFLDLLERQFPIEEINQVLILRSPAEFAHQLNLHVNHLNKSLKEITGQTTSQLISNRILQESRVLLRSTHWSISEIAWSLGFEEPNHFSGFFKNKVKMSPSRFRLTTGD